MGGGVRSTIAERDQGPCFAGWDRRGHQESREAELPRSESRGWSFVTKSTRSQDPRADRCTGDLVGEGGPN
jgi:hypothetical protein